MSSLILRGKFSLCDFGLYVINIGGTKINYSTYHKDKFQYKPILRKLKQKNKDQKQNKKYCKDQNQTKKIEETITKK